MIPALRSEVQSAGEQEGGGGYLSGLYHTEETLVMAVLALLQLVIYLLLSLEQLYKEISTYQCYIQMVSVKFRAHLH